MYYRNRTDVDRSVMQRYPQCNVLYDQNIMSYTLPHIKNVHKCVKVQMADANAVPPYKFTNLCRKVMSMTILGMDPLVNHHNAYVFDAIIPI
jgi:hypothetical protein